MSNYADVRKAVPAVDDVVSRYAVGYIDNIEENVSQPETAQQTDYEAELSFICQLLLSAGGEEAKVGDLRSSLFHKFKVVYEKNVNRTYGNAALRKLDRDTLLSAQQSNAAKFDVGDRDQMDLDLLSGNKGRTETRVDRKKLAKQEKKIAAKLAKRQDTSFMKELTYEGSKLLQDNNEQDYDEFFLTVNPLELGPSEGKSKDIKIENFDLYVGEGTRILADSTLTLAHGHRYGLVGSNGIGKSTLLKALSRRELAVPKHITILYVEQEVKGDEKSVLTTVLDADVWRKYLLKDQQRITDRLQAISEEHPEASEDVQQILDQEADDLNTQLNNIFEKLGDMESDRAEPRAAAILSGLGFSPESQRKPTNTFSGGWRMRISLARALFCKPDLLMLDEPSNMLDLPSITFLSNYLLTYPSTVLVVSHDRAFLNEVATDIIHQHSERLDYYRGANFDEFYNTREERFKNAKREFDNQMAYRKHMQAFIDKFRYNAAKSQEAQSRIKKLEKLPILEEPSEEADFSFSFPDPESISPPVLQISEGSFGYGDGPDIIRDVDMTVDMDSRIALVGGNGSGKTTLLKLLLGTNNPRAGHVTRHPRLRIGYFAQHHVDGMDLSLNAVEWLATVKPGKSEEEYRRHLGAFGITGSLGLRKLGVMSGGQKSRVAFAALGLSEPHILILDEPSNHLDIAALDALADALNRFKGGILMVSHDVVTINRVCKDIMVCEDGRVYKTNGSIDDYKKHILNVANSSGVVAEH